jgi:hypothetical protein
MSGVTGFRTGSSWRLLSAVTVLIASARRLHSSAGSEMAKVNSAATARPSSSLRCACDSASYAVQLALNVVQGLRLSVVDLNLGHQRLTDSLLLALVLSARLLIHVKDLRPLHPQGSPVPGLDPLYQALAHPQEQLDLGMAPTVGCSYGSQAHLLQMASPPS